MSNQIYQGPKVYARLDRLKHSPRKANLILQMIRGLDVSQALAALKFCEKRFSVEVHKLLLSAMANAENNMGLDLDRLVVCEAYVGKSITLRRWLPRAKGRASPLRKRYSQLTVCLAEV